MILGVIHTDLYVQFKYIQCNLDLVTLFVSAKLSLNCIMSLNRMILCSKLKNGLCKMVNKSQVVT